MYAIHKAKCIVQHIIKVRASATATAHSLMQFLPFKLVEDLWFFFLVKKKRGPKQHKFIAINT